MRLQQFDDLLFGASLRMAASNLLVDLGQRDRARLELLLQLSTAARMSLSDCLQALFPDLSEKKAQAALRIFRMRLNDLAVENGDPLRFVVDQKKRDPASARACWFTGRKLTDVEATAFSRAGAGDAPVEEVLNRGIATTTTAAFSGKRTISVFVCYPRATKPAVDELLGRLKACWGMSRAFHFEPWGDWAIAAGEEWHEEIQRQLAEADVALLFLSPEFFHSRYIWEHEVPKILCPSNPKPCVPVAMGLLDLTFLDLRGLEKRQIFRLEESDAPKIRSFVECSSERLKQAFALELHRQMETYLNRRFGESQARDVTSTGDETDTPRGIGRREPAREGWPGLDRREAPEGRAPVHPPGHRRSREHDAETPASGDGPESAGPIPLPRSHVRDAGPGDEVHADDPLFQHLATGDEGDEIAIEVARRFVPNPIHTGNIEALKDASAAIKAEDGGITAVDFLERWACDGTEAPFCAVLGEYGVGKTTTLKQLTRRLLALREEKKPAPLPIFIDLRNYVHADDGDASRLPTLREILSVVLARQPRLAHQTTLTPDDLLSLVREDGALIIFDGLDEKIVHLTPERARAFIRELWGSVPPQNTQCPPPSPGRAGDPRLFPPSQGGVRGGRVKLSKRALRDHSASPVVSHRGKMILSCRSHYFQDVWSQNALLTGEDREGIRAADYRACLILPFTEKQIRQYLAGVLGPDRVEPAMELFSGVHNLRELAERPYLLSIIVDQIDGVERRRAAGEMIRAIDLYAELARRWLHRDDGKHRFNREEKQRLMEDLAAAMIRAGDREWPWERLMNWLTDVLRADPRIAFRHQRTDLEVLEQDLRTATFILRPDCGGSERLNHFRFAHSSLQEYFLACHLARALRENRSDCWNLPGVSQETFGFLGQLLAGAGAGSVPPLPEGEGTRAEIETLNSILASDCLPAATLAFRYWLHAIAHGYPEPSPAHVNLASANFEEWTIRGHSPDRPLRLRGANLHGTKLSRARLENVDLTTANLKHLEARQALFLNVAASHSDLSQSDLCALQWRVGSLAEAKLNDAKICGTHWIDVDLTGAALPENWEQRAASIERDRRVAEPIVQPSAAYLVTLAGHSSPVRACGYSRDGTRIVSGSDDSTLKVWDAKSGGCLHALTGHTNAVVACSFSPDSRRIVSGSYDNTLKIWDAESGACLKTLTAHSASVFTCDFSPDGRRIVSGSYDNTLKVWDVEMGVALVTIVGISNLVVACCFSPDGRRILCGSADGTVQAWDAASGALLLTRAGRSEKICVFVFSPEGRRIVSSTDDRPLTVFDVETGACLVTLAGHTNSFATCCSFSRDGTRIVAGAFDGALKIWDAETGACLETLAGHSDSVEASSFSHDDRRIVAGAFDGALKIWDAATGACLFVLAGHSVHHQAVRFFSPDNRRFVCSSPDGAHTISDTATGRRLLTLAGRSGSIALPAFSPDGRRIVSGFDDGSLRVWDAETGASLLTLAGHSDWVQACVFSPDSRRIVSGSGDETLKVWDAETGASLLTLAGHSDWIQACAFSPDGRRVVSGSNDCTLKIWEADNGSCLHTLSGHREWVFACSFSPDGRRIVSGSTDEKVKIWDAESGVCLLTLAGHSCSVMACSFSPDGRRIVSGSADAMLKIWDIESGACLLTITGHSGAIRDCNFSPNGRQIVGASADGSLKIWDAETGECLSAAVQLPDDQTAALDLAHNRILSASPEAWRFLGWRWTDPATGSLRILPAEFFGPLPR